MRSKELSMEVKETILKLKKENKSIREISELLDVAKSTVGNILRKVECTGSVGNSVRSGRPRKTTEVDDRRILSMVKKNPFTTSTQVKKTLQEIGVSVSKSTVKRRLHEGKCKRFPPRCKPLTSLKNEGQDCQPSGLPPEESCS